MVVSESDVKFYHSSSSSSIRCEVGVDVIAAMVKLKSLIQTLMMTHMRQAAKVLSKAKSMVSQMLKQIHLIHIIQRRRPLFIIKKNKVDAGTKLFLGSFRMHYNWCSDSHLMPHPAAAAAPPAAIWNSLVWIHDDDDVVDDVRTSTAYNFSAYPSWLQEKDDVIDDDDDIDKMAGAFIANCREKFKLEKQESERKFQEMLARSV